ncbi:urease accessory protein UreE [Pseudoponticoccus marisrubri]|uniref:Urease accessory protein UreE n=1 Tax=Pseudoponticoccus marisrubri TaxID=1685382 RepID=A0A0W7WFP6_9RHOB|nr:urease accessory protein UreE [Pseudoponticoccus marisrubri]KUF09381.1 urease accessory protein UreE [Pseudoponticoccus marisrubri]
MSDLPVTQTLHRKGTWTGPADWLELSYDDRFFRRKKLVSDGGIGFVADFAQTLSLDHGDALELPGGRLVEIVAAPEDLFEVRGPALARLAWHIGNRHTPCQIEGAALLIQRDPVIGHMLEHLGAELVEVRRPFTPEGGAYGHGRTHAHEHGKSAHAH